MYTCSITGMPFQPNQKAILIPILIRKDFVDSTIANTNVRPLPISVSGSFNEEIFNIDIEDKEHEKFMMDMISNVLGKNINFENFQQLRGDEKDVHYDDKDYVINFFACHHNIYNSIITNFKTEASFSKQKLNFNDYCNGFVDYIINDTRHLSHLVNEPYRTKLGSNRTGFIVPVNFDEIHLSYLAEIKFINSFLSTIGKQWEISGICSYNSDLAFNIYKNSILTLS